MAATERNDIYPAEPAMQTAQFAETVARLHGHRARRLTAWFGECLIAWGSYTLQWRTNAQHRSDLLRAPATVRRELLARGIDVDLEIGKPFWRP